MLAVTVAVVARPLELRQQQAFVGQALVVLLFLFTLLVAHLLRQHFQATSLHSFEETYDNHLDNHTMRPIDLG
jgi:hypothetical protein